MPVLRGLRGSPNSGAGTVAATRAWGSRSGRVSLDGVMPITVYDDREVVTCQWLGLGWIGGDPAETGPSPAHGHARRADRPGDGGGAARSAPGSLVAPSASLSSGNREVIGFS